MIDHLDKIDIEFPVPGETEIIVHVLHYKGGQKQNPTYKNNVIAPIHCIKNR
jgi:hypothetical protein